MKPNRSYEIRVMEKADVPNIIELIGSTISPEDAEFAKSIFASYFKPSRKSWRGGKSYVATLRGQVVGVSGFYKWGKSYWLGWFAVTPECQGLGVGSKLLEEVEKVVRAKGAKELFVYTSILPKFKKTRDFYKRRGFEEVSKVDHPRWEKNMVFFRKRL
ncbi:MAG: hypothetical protein AVW06_03080 [Hadesarchaea archaeon DG-33-1]|nr:MAG: hypothetical protein AVW06_03080 [Hadesarchaea archaeon DG-33-1]